MNGNRITLPAAYMIETLRSNGVSDDTLLTQVEQKDVSAWEELSTFDFNDLVELYNHDQNTFKSILRDGYTVKFVTIRGLQTLLKLRFDKIPERDYQLTSKGITQLRIEEQQLTIITQMLSKNWIISEPSSPNNNEQFKEVTIELI